MQLSKETSFLTFFSTISFALDYRIMLDGLVSVSIAGRTATELMAKLQDTPFECDSVHLEMKDNLFLTCMDEK